MPTTRTVDPRQRPCISCQPGVPTGELPVQASLPRGPPRSPARGLNPRRRGGGAITRRGYRAPSAKTSAVTTTSSRASLDSGTGRGRCAAERPRLMTRDGARSRARAWSALALALSPPSPSLDRRDNHAGLPSWRRWLAIAIVVLPWRPRQQGSRTPTTIRQRSPGAGRHTLCQTDTFPIPRRGTRR